MEDSKQIRDGTLLTALYIAMLLFVTFVPSMVIFIVFLMPLPFIIYASRYDQKSLLKLFIVVALISFFLTLLTSALLILPIFILTASGGIAIGIALSQSKSPYETWIQGTIGFAIGLLFVFLFTQFVLEINWADEIDHAIGQSFENLAIMIDQFDQFGSSEQINEQLEVLQEQMGIIKDLIPAGIALLAIIMAFLTQWFAYRIISHLENKRLRFPPIRLLQFPTAIVWIYIIGILVSVFERNPTSGLFIGAQNVLSLAGFLMILQGYSFIFFYAHHKKKSNGLPIIAVILSVLLPLLLYVIRLIGLIDMAFSLRNSMQKSKGVKKR